MKNKELLAWEKATNKLSDYFIEKYFGKDWDNDETFWVSDEPGGTLFINDYFFNMDDITNFIRFEYSKKDMFNFYDYNLELATKDILGVNIKNWRKLIKNKKK